MNPGHRATPGTGRRLLVFENHHAGDALLAVPFLRGAKRVFDKVAVCCTREGAPLFERAGVNDLIVSEKPGDRSLPGVREAVRTFHPDVAVCVWADVRMHRMMRASGAAERAGLPMNAANFYGSHLAWRKRGLALGMLATSFSQMTGGRLLTRAVQRTGPLQSHRDDWRQLAALIGVTPDESVPWIRTEAISHDAALARELAEARAAGRLVIALHHGGRLDTKRWAADRFVEVARRLAAKADVALVTIEPPDCAPLALGGVPALSTRTPSVAALANTLAACDVVLCNDSLAGHLAAALGKRVVSIFGSGHPAWFAPAGSEAWTVKSEVCRFNPCLDRCLMGRPICLEAIPVERVLETVERCLADFRGAGKGAS